MRRDNEVVFAVAPAALSTREIENRDGVHWCDAPAPSARHKHRWQTRGYIGLDYLERCACGAASEGDGDWFFIGRDRPRVAARAGWLERLKARLR